ncbi:thiamine pyrophosphate-dependent enzyme [Nocardioides sp.]|uniref:thiamine pyrophosphate-dependent enzyme n=1 Tax=Nocardioides sp. TaxID=35761 RepID=UPI003527C794
MNIGLTLETLNLAAAWSLPLCLFVENNLYAVSTVSEVTAETRSARGPGFGIRSWKVDGMDPLAVHSTMQEALQHLRRAGGRPWSRPTSIASSTRTAPSRARPSATGARRRRPSGAAATRWR